MPARAVFLATVLAALVAAVACSRKEAACEVDLDCGEGSFCRSGICATVGRDGGPADDGAAAVCVSPGSTCTTDNYCCSPPCNSSGRCAGGGPGTSGRPTSCGASSSGASGTTSSGGSCQDLYAICSFDGECCPGLSCDPSGTCR
ncbi:MAG TPA: hypothetical protein VLT33_13880 [Labilithrix sp.]|nr:hypothetical protein [Labilithrix sp.]